MTWPKKRLTFSAPFLVCLFTLLGCGVKGDPLPPERPPEIGRGRPTYRRATEEIKIEKNRGRDATPENDKEDSDDDERE